MRRRWLVDKVLPAIVIVVAVAVILGLMVLSWRRRVRSQADLPELAPVPSDLGTVLGEFDGLYLASTPSGDRFNRIAVRGLGFRERGSILVATAGFVVLVDKFIPKAAVSAVGRASWTIDRGVEPDGLSVISWTLGDTSVDSYFRLDDPEGFLEAAGSIIQQTGQK
jgi:hypothetical protein